MLKLSRNLAPYSLSLFIVLVMLAVQSAADLYLPTLNADIINKGIAVGDTAYILRTGLIMLLIAVFVALASAAVAYFSAQNSMGFGRDIREKLFVKISSFSQHEVDTFGAPSLINRVTNDVNQVQQTVLMGQRMMISAPIMLVGGIIMALRQDVQLSWILAVSLPVMGIIMGVTMSHAMPLFTELQKKLDTLSRVAREKLSGVRVIRAFIREDYERKRFDKSNSEHAELNLKIGRIMSMIFPVVTFILNGTQLAILWFGAQRVDIGSMQVGNLTAFITYAMQIMFSFLMAAMMFVMLPRAEASAKRITAVLDTVPNIQDPENPVAPPESGSELVFDHVSFRYPGAEEDVLMDIHFTVKPGETAAIIGSTGSGKSTIVNLVPRFYDVTGGSVTLGGKDIRKLSLHDLRSRVGIVPQKAFLFTGTIADNLRYGKEDATEEEMRGALGIAQAVEFVDEMPEQMETEITQGGTNVSGGQRQRLAIARALIMKPQVLIFDDSFSAVDVNTDAALRKALKPAVTNAAVIIVSQRVSTVREADKIVVLDEGKMVGIGGHKELMKTCAVYREIVQSQNKEESA